MRIPPPSKLFAFWGLFNKNALPQKWDSHLKVLCFLEAVFIDLNLREVVSNGSPWQSQKISTKRLGKPPCMKKTMSSVSSTEFSSTKVLKFLHLMEKKNWNQDWKEPSERVWPVACLPNGLVVIEPGVLVHRLVVQELLCHLPWIVEWYQNHMDMIWHKHFMHTLLWTRWTCKSQQMSSWGGPLQCWLTFGHLTNKV